MTDIRNKPPPLTRFGPPAPRKPLTAVQEEIARLLARGDEIEAIAAHMRMHGGTIKYHITQAARAINLPDSEALTDREQVIIWAFWEYRKSA